MNDDAAARIEETTGLLRATCAEWDIQMAGDDSVVEGDAERLLAYRPGSLRAQRLNGTCCMPRRRVGNRWRYRLRDVAELIERDYVM